MTGSETQLNWVKYVVVWVGFVVARVLEVRFDACGGGAGVTGAGKAVPHPGGQGLLFCRRGRRSDAGAAREEAAEVFEDGVRTHHGALGGLFDVVVEAEVGHVDV